MTRDLTFDELPDLPQVATLKRVASALWRRNEVAALWLGGSFARGEADEYSDLDLRAAVVGEALDRWSRHGLSDLLGEVVVGGSTHGWEGTVFHHVVLENGVILDLLVQCAEREPPQDFTVVLGCRDAAFGERLARAQLTSSQKAGPADPAAVRQVIVDFWVGSLKHIKVIHRGLDMMVLVGLGHELSALIRLWYVAATGQDTDVRRATIHALTQTVRAVMKATGTHGMETLGGERRSRADLMRIIELNREEVARVGRRLAERLGFDYPEALERTVRATWQRFVTAWEEVESGTENKVEC